DLGKPAGDERRAAIRLKTDAGGSARGDRHHVLERARDLEADRIIARVDAKVRRVKELLCALRAPFRVAGDGYARRLMGRDLRGEARAREEGRGVRRLLAEHVPDDFMGELVGSDLDPFAGADEKKLRPPKRS